MADRTSRLVYCLALIAAMLLPLPIGSAAQEPLFSILKGDNQPSSGTLRQRFIQGKNFQAIAPIEAGKLLDPRTVETRWNGRPIPHYLFYKTPEVALLFMLPDGEISQAGEGRLTISASLLNGPKAAAESVSVHIREGDIALRASAREALQGRRITVTSLEGEPIAGAFVFGQRRSDLLTGTDERGVALMDSPERSAGRAHIAWKEGYWPVFFDPLMNAAPKLAPIAAGAKGTTFPYPILNHAGEEITDGLILIGADLFIRWPSEEFVSPRERRR